jgi:hypothetical protein
MASWGFPLNSAMEAEVYADLNVMDSTSDWIEAPWRRAKTASSAPWLHCQSRPVKEPTIPANPICTEIALLSLRGPSPSYTLNDVD